MGIITKIEQQKRNDDRVNIYVDDKFFIAIFKELVYTFNLKKGNEINEEELKPILDDEMYIKAKNKALNILSHADQSEKKLKEKLSSEFDENIIERVID
ncbi:recombination regulator RecX, partial [Clostridioides difficile]|nr:recombination regulator RecX [Clostridioides difficile]